MARTTATAVKKIIDTDLTDGIVEAYIDDASALVDQQLTNEGLGSTLLTSIEKWLAAHMIATSRERMAKKEGAGGASIEYTGKFGEGLAATPYGQQVRELDTTGKLASLGRKVASFKSIKSFKDD
jgi:hypothetical protein